MITLKFNKKKFKTVLHYIIDECGYIEQTKIFKLEICLGELLKNMKILIMNLYFIETQNTV